MKPYEYLLIRHHRGVLSGTVYQFPKTTTVRLAAPTDAKSREEYGYYLHQTTQLTIEDVDSGIYIADRELDECSWISLIDTRDPASIKLYNPQFDDLMNIKATWETNGLLPSYLRRVTRTTKPYSRHIAPFGIDELKDLFFMNGNDSHEIELSEFTVLTK